MLTKSTHEKFNRPPQLCTIKGDFRHLKSPHRLIKTSEAMKFFGGRISGEHIELFKKFIKSFLQTNVVHGLIFFGQRQLTSIEKCFWCLIILYSNYFCLKLCYTSLGRYATHNTMMSLEFDYYWNTTKAAVTICPNERLNWQHFSAYSIDYNGTALRKIELYKFLESLANITYDTMSTLPASASIDATLQSLNITPNLYSQLLYNLTIDYTQVLGENESILLHTIIGKVNDEYIYARQILTENGLCYLVNSYLPLEYSSSYAITGKMPEIPLNTTPFMNVSQAVYFEGIPQYRVNGLMFKDFRVYISDPYDVLISDRSNFFAELPHEVTVELREISADDHFESTTTIAQRHCRFVHESNLTHFSMYSKELCMQECRLNVVFKKCGCIPHFYPNRIPRPKPVCSYKQLKSCVAEIAGSFYLKYCLKLGFFIMPHNLVHHTNSSKCYCLPNCRSILPSIVELIAVRGEIIFTGKSVDLIVQKHHPIRLTRRVLYSFSDLLVTIGGTAGLLLGFSCLGLVEIIYFFTLRLFWFTRGYRY